MWCFNLPVAHSSALRRHCAVAWHHCVQLECCCSCFVVRFGWLGWIPCQRQLPRLSALTCFGSLLPCVLRLFPFILLQFAGFRSCSLPAGSSLPAHTRLQAHAVTPLPAARLPQAQALSAGAQAGPRQLCHRVSTCSASAAMFCISKAPRVVHLLAQWRIGRLHCAASDQSLLRLCWLHLLACLKLLLLGSFPCTATRRSG